jgi:hypothetical protein
MRSLSLAYWFLCVLGSPAVPKLYADNLLRAAIDDEAKTLTSPRTLRDCAQKKLPFRNLKDMKGSPLSEASLGKMFAQLISWVDMVCATPSPSEKKPFKGVENHTDRGHRMDEAANMTRADLAGVWGSTLLPSP